VYVFLTGGAHPLWRAVHHHHERFDYNNNTLNKKSQNKRCDCVVFDARILHCGNANVSFNKTRALLNFSFRNPKVEGALGHEGSIRPGYCQAMSLADVGEALRTYAKGDADPFRKYGSGLL